MTDFVSRSFPMAPNSKTEKIDLAKSVTRHQTQKRSKYDLRSQYLKFDELLRKNNQNSNSAQNRNFQ